MKSAKCPCCGQKSNLRKLECVMCGAYSYSSRAQIRDGLHPCRCGGTLEPVCLMDRAQCFDDEYGREAWAEYAGRFPGTTDPTYSRRARQAAATRKAKRTYAAVRVATEPAMPF